MEMYAKYSAIGSEKLQAGLIFRIYSVMNGHIVDEGTVHVENQGVVFHEAILSRLGQLLSNNFKMLSRTKHYLLKGFADWPGQIVTSHKNAGLLYQRLAFAASRFPWLQGDPRLADMLAVPQSKDDAEGRFTLESVWMAWKE